MRSRNRKIAKSYRPRHGVRRVHALRLHGAFITPSSMPRLALLFIIYHLSFSPAGAQSFRDFAFEQDSSAWLTSDNAAALTRFSMPSISRADVYGQLQRGGFVDYSQSPKSTEAGASVESYYRLSPKTVVYGRMSYDNFAGRDMAGSAFIRSERLPFDIVEDSLTNLGRKHLDSYQLVGAVGVALWRGLSVGVRAEYTSANYAKYKDLRHKNLLMDLKVMPAVHVSCGKAASIGLNYLYRRQTESVDFDTYGKTDKTYMSLISYGVFTGRVEQYGGEGYANANRSMPWLDERHGVTGLFNRLEVRLRPVFLKRGLHFLERFPHARLIGGEKEIPTGGHGRRQRQNNEQLVHQRVLPATRASEISPPTCSSNGTERLSPIT